MSRARVTLLRGHQAAPWDLRPWEQLGERFEVACLVTGSNRYQVESLDLERTRGRALRDLLPPGALGDLAVHLPGDRYIGLERHLDGTDVVHAAELSYWFAAEAARHKERLGYRLVLTVWETLPLLDAYRNRRASRHRRQTLAAADLFLAATERARDALLLEGVPAERIEVSPPGVDLERFRTAAAGGDGGGGGDGGDERADGRDGGDERAGGAGEGHLVLSPGRLVWEKGHQDVLRAVAALRRGIVDGQAPRVLVIGSGPEENRLRAHADELGIGDLVEVRTSVPYDDMPRIYASASCMVLASLSSAGCMVVTGPPHCFWEEQFGMVLAEAMAAGLPILASASGAIPEVAGAAATLFSPGDWPGLARALAEGPLSRTPGARVEHPPELVERYSTRAAADRLAAAYERVLSGSP